MRTIFENPLNPHIEKIDIDETALTSMTAKLKSRSSYDSLLERLDFYSTVAGLDGSQEKEFTNNGNPSTLTITFEGNILQATTFLQSESFVTLSVWWVTQAIWQARETLNQIPDVPVIPADRVAGMSAT